MSPTGDLTCNPGMHPGNLLVCRPVLNPLSHISQGQRQNLKSSKRKTASIILTADFSAEIFQVRRDSHEIGTMKKSKLKPRLLYPARLSFKTEREIKSFQDMKKLKEFITTKSVSSTRYVKELALRRRKDKQKIIVIKKKNGNTYY